MDTLCCCVEGSGNRMVPDLSDHLALPLVSVGICALRGAGAMFICGTFATCPISHISSGFSGCSYATWLQMFKIEKFLLSLGPGPGPGHSKQVMGSTI